MEIHELKEMDASQLVRMATDLKVPGAGKLRLRELLFKVRVPNALPFLFSALKVGTTLSVIAAIVSELDRPQRFRLQQREPSI